MKLNLIPETSLLALLYREMFDVFDHVKKLHGQTNYLIK